MSEIVKNFKINLSTKPDFVITDSNTIDNVKNFVVDVLYKIPSVETLVTPNADGKVYFEGLSTVTEIVESGVEEFYNFNYFLGLNISNTPWNIIVENFNAKNYLLVFGALMIPVLAYLTQVLSIKLMQAKNNTGDQMAQQMKMMNTFMPFMSLIMCFSVPVGLGIYWIVSAAYRIPQQILLNRHFDKMDLEAVIKKNEAKVKAKREKMGISEEQMRAIANRKTRTLQNKAAYNNEAEKEEQLNTANEMRANAKPGSLASKANMVRDYNERNSRK
jgi:YidC/Oxa1 family membrane protein insertase